MFTFQYACRNYEKGSKSQQKPENIDIFEAKVRDFCDAILEGRPSPIPGEEIIYNQAICDGIYRSSKLHKEVEIVIPKLD